MKTQRRLNITIIILLVIVFAAFLFIPRKRDLKDGGTIRYESCGFGAFYCVEHRHKIHGENGVVYYEIGTLVTVLGTEIYNDVHVDFDNPMPAGPSPEDMDRLNSAMESARSE